MSVLINFNICDNSKECSGIAICPTGALSYDENKNTIVIDNSKCTNCSLCEKECPIGAIHVAKNDEEYSIIKKEISSDNRKIKDLFVDRYGAMPLSDFFIIEEKDLINKIKTNKLLFIEVYHDDYIQCLLKSIPIKDLIDNIDEDVLYYKIKINDVLEETYNINEYPTLLIFKDSKLLGKIDGYYDENMFKELKNKINEILKK
ncbi:MAG TPA: 4Fe-4S binding protein [Bacilli bacterium]|nr:4Fe-4S binding protein [Bacilli bacterium]